MFRQALPALVDATHDTHRDLSAIERAFLFWIDDGQHPEVLATGPGPHDTLPMADALELLRACPRALTPAQARHLGLAADASVATAVAALVEARTDPDGPRCRSYRSAVLYLSGLAILLADADEHASLHRHRPVVTTGDLVGAV